jgi:hypothetical protein
MVVYALIGLLPMVSPGLAFNSTVRTIREFLESIILPYVKLFSFIRPVQVGGALMDLSFLAAFFLLIIAMKVLPPAIAGLG